MLIILTTNLISHDIQNNNIGFFYILKNNAITYTTFSKMLHFIYYLHVFTYCTLCHILYVFTESVNFTHFTLPFVEDE